ncbi:MAG: hypothetical protein A3G87_05020 [Omnitrophica bacterium RIFCSPLOWO2_12_FULL_50_11]|nr:MAG: hypothetical protein A3G87_05020 [Omnitrophica bacterium RIFCSPLOWO2_12_FULL_50_11]
MKFILKTPVKRDLHVLNEREIQERLYGSFRTGRGSAPGGTIEGEGEMPKLRFSPPGEANHWAKRFQALYARVRNSVTNSSKLIPLRSAGMAAGVVLSGAILFLAVSRWFPSDRSGRQEPGMATGAALVSSERSAEPRETGVGLESADTTLPTAVKVNFSPPDETEKLADGMNKVYAVQVCTYQRESDAVRLTKQLQEMNFKPFYRRMVSRQFRTSYYVVFLGQDPTYAGAQSLLRKFQRTDLFTDFSDSFIQSL